MNKKVSIAFDIASVSSVEMDRVSIESECRKTKEQGSGWLHLIAEYRVRGSFVRAVRVSDATALHDTSKLYTHLIVLGA